MTAPNASKPAANASLVRQVLADRRFVVVAILLAVTAVAWPLVTHALGLVQWKLPVPCPNVTLDDKFRNLSFPKKLGVADRYQMVEDDGVLFQDPRTHKPIKDGQPDGEVIWDEDTLATAGIGTAADKMYLTQGASNWYLSRIYEDTSEKPDSLYRYWHLDVTYYTGSLDTVPHIPEVCLTAGGMTVPPSESFHMDPIAEIAGPQNKAWSGPLEFRRVPYENPENSSRFVQYYIFSLNGNPEWSREKVRLLQLDLWKNYAYFAKMQVYPLHDVGDPTEMDRHARDFIRAALPAVLKDLPTADDLQKLEAARKASK